jgi:hypothetical protein
MAVRPVGGAFDSTARGKVAAGNRGRFTETAGDIAARKSAEDP